MIYKKSFKEYSMQITFREQWLDRRLAYDHLSLPNAPKFLTVPHIKDNVWMPDTFFPVWKFMSKIFFILKNLATSRRRNRLIDT